MALMCHPGKERGHFLGLPRGTVVSRQNLFYCCLELRKSFSFSFLPFESFSTLTVPDLQSALITKFLLFRRLTCFVTISCTYCPLILHVILCVYYVLTSWQPHPDAYLTWYYFLCKPPLVVPLLCITEKMSQCNPQKTMDSTIKTWWPDPN